MGTPVKLYQQEMHQNLGFFCTWLPSDPLKLGDVGILEGGRFRRQASLAELGINLSDVRKGTPQDLQYTSKSGTVISLRAGVSPSTVLPASAEIDIEFGRQGAFLFHASNVTNESFQNQSALANSILALHKKGTWRNDWYVIEAVHTADCATIIISEDSTAHLVINASSNGVLGTLPLADPHVHLQVSSSSGKMVQIVAARDLRPLYSCSRLRETWLGDARVTPVRGVTRSNNMNLIQASIEDLLGS